MGYRSYFTVGLSQRSTTISSLPDVEDVVARGYSQAPQILHEPNVFSFQLAFLLQYIGWNKVNVVGYSMV